MDTPTTYTSDPPVEREETAPEGTAENPSSTTAATTESKSRSNTAAAVAGAAGETNAAKKKAKKTTPSSAMMSSTADKKGKGNTTSQKAKAKARARARAKAKSKTKGKAESDEESDVEDGAETDSESDSSNSSDSSTSEDSTDDSSDSDSESESESESESDDSGSETEKDKRKRRTKKRSKTKLKSKDKKKKNAKGKEKRKMKKKSNKESSSDSSSDSGSVSSDSADTVNEDQTTTTADATSAQLSQMQVQLIAQQLSRIEQMLSASSVLGTGLGQALTQTVLMNTAWTLPHLQAISERLDGKRAGRKEDVADPHAEVKEKSKKKKSKKKSKKSKKKTSKRASKLAYKRVDYLWDVSIHNYKLTDTAEDDESSEYDQYLFNIRRTFDWEGKYKMTYVDVKSKLIKEALQLVMEGVKGVSLVQETPTIDPNLLFLYLEDLRQHYKDLKHQKVEIKRGKRKAQKRLAIKRKHIKVLLKYLDKDYAATKKTLYPMLEGGLITFDLLWALYKPNTLAYTTTYGSVDEPRAFRIETAEKESSFMRGEWYSAEGKYLEYDGKTWGMGYMECEIASFKGARKITTLDCYPLKYHRNEAKIRAQLIERGKKFVALQGVHYKSHKGMAYYKKRKQIVKVNINGRIMVDPAIHRRILPNYNVSTVKQKDWDSENEEDDDDSECNCSDDEFEEEQQQPFDTKQDDDGEKAPKTKFKIVFDDKEKPHLIEVELTPEGDEVAVEKLDEVPSMSDEPSKKKGAPENNTKDNKSPPTFADDEYLIASPVVLGFAFAEKLWLEFTVSGIKDIVWNEGAYESLVLEDNTKAIVKALVESHKYHPAESIDDVIQGKGKGLVAVLHGPPGTGKTLTAEGISELLKCPLYMVSMGELGTDPRTLETELQKILDIAHAWGAVLLLDEADVFLEKRTLQDVHRNALVSIFLRLLEYFQGILFLTTNRVETFDDAFQSRIHVALRYGELNQKAKRSVFKMFIERVRVLEGVDTMPFTEADFTALSKHALNGRQIKNTIRTAQALAVNQGEPLSMVHIKRVLDVSNAFDRDLKGGPGFEDAMRGYF